MKTLRSLKALKGKRVLLRCDLNVPMDKGKISDDSRLKASLETIQYLISKDARVVIVAHLGEPKGRRDGALSLKPVAARLGRLVKKKIAFVPETIGEKAAKSIASLKDGEILVLENLRFDEGELTDDGEFAKYLAAPFDLYVNDAFSVSHRKQASVSAIKKFLPSYAGLLLEKEVLAMNRIMKPKKPLVVIMGGSKISTKAPLIRCLYPKASYILLGGALANNFFKQEKLEIGRSLFDEDSLPYLKSLYKGKKLLPKIILPTDVIVRSKKGPRLAKISEVRADEYIYDIGPATIGRFADIIKDAQTIVWNGPMGKFEEQSYKQGSLSVARLVAARSTGKAFGLVGGGETLAVLELSKMSEYIDWISMAGGAMLSYLGGEKMPGLKGII